MVQAFLGIGSNLGDRRANCRLALERLASVPATRIVRVSPLLETAPCEGVAGGPFLNGAVEVATELPPRELLDSLRAIEVALGRPAGHRPGRARTIDLDLLLYGSLVLNEADLIVPHPRMAGRRFVLEPLAAIAPTIRHPVLHLTVEELLSGLDQTKAADASAARG